MTRHAFDLPSVLSAACALALLTLIVAAAPADGASRTRTVTGKNVSFQIPIGADKSSFQPTSDGRFSYATAVKVEGLGKVTVTVGPRGDPEATLKNELFGAHASARTKHFRKSRAKAIEINRGKGVQALISGETGGSTAYCITWTKKRVFELTLESKRSGTDPLDHWLWKALVSSFRSDEPALK